jgi:DNA-binding response OmpR family regulator
VKVLLVEDELRMVKQLRQGLEREREGYVVLVAHDGETGLELARTTDPDLIVLDWMLPKLDGAEVARRLRRAKVQTPILMLTARDAAGGLLDRPSRARGTKLNGLNAKSEDASPQERARDLDH